MKNWLEKKLNNRAAALLVVFVVSGLVCSLLELSMGLATNADYALWDYRDMFCNFMGQVCLQNSIGFALAATIVTYVIYPLLKSFFDRIQPAMN